MRHLLRSAFVLLIVLVFAAPASAVTPVHVFVLEGDQFYPSGNESYLAYTSNTAAHPQHWNAFVFDRSTETTRRVNEAGTEGFTGGFDPGTNELIYQQVARGSAIYLYDADTLQRTKAPGVNTPDWEWDPRISTTYISFFRDVGGVNGYTTRVYLYTRETGRLQKLASYPSAESYTQNGFTGERYVTWTRCGADTCVAFVYDTQGGVLKKIPSVNGRPQYAPLVDEANAWVFFVRSGFGCGVSVAFWKLPVDHLGASPTRIAVLPDGIDVDGYASWATNPDSGDQELLFARIRCNGDGSDIWALPGLIAAPV